MYNKCGWQDPIFNSLSLIFIFNIKSFACFLFHNNLHHHGEIRSLLLVCEASSSDNEALSHIMQKMEDTDNEITMIHNSIQENYRKKFPELETLVQNPIVNACVVKRIGNEPNITLVDLDW